MSSFNEIGGVRGRAQLLLLRTVLREDGLVGAAVCDFNAIAESVEHGVARDVKDAARLSIWRASTSTWVAGAGTPPIRSSCAGGGGAGRAADVRFPRASSQVQPGAVEDLYADQGSLYERHVPMPASRPGARSGDSIDRAAEERGGVSLSGKEGEGRPDRAVGRATVPTCRHVVTAVRPSTWRPCWWRAEIRGRGGGRVRPRCSLERVSKDADVAPCCRRRRPTCRAVWRGSRHQRRAHHGHIWADRAAAGPGRRSGGDRQTAAAVPISGRPLVAPRLAQQADACAACTVASEQAGGRGTRSSGPRPVGKLSASWPRTEGQTPRTTPTSRRGARRVRARPSMTSPSRSTYMDVPNSPLSLRPRASYRVRLQRPEGADPRRSADGIVGWRCHQTHRRQGGRERSSNSMCATWCVGSHARSRN